MRLLTIHEIAIALAVMIIAIIIMAIVYYFRWIQNGKN